MRSGLVIAIWGGVCGLVACGLSITGDASDGAGLTPDGGSSSSSSSSSSSGSSSGGEDGAAAIDATPPSPCGDVQTSAVNCGACNHSCLGGTCIAGLCQPIVFADNEPGARGVAVLQNTRLLWTREQAGIVRGKLLDGSANAATFFDPFDYPTDIATDAQGVVYYSSRDDGSVNRRNTDATGWSVGAYVTPTGISVEGTTMYVAIQNDDAIESLNAGTTTGDFQVRASDVNYPSDVAVIGGKIYVASSSGILLASRNPPHTTISPTSRFLDGGTGDLLHTGLVVDGAFIYFTIGEKGIVARVPIDGSAPATVLASGQQDPQGIAVSATFIYWANRASGTIMQVAK